MKSSGLHVKSRKETPELTLVELPLLFALATVPTFFVLGLDAPFEPPKATLLWVAASVVVTITVWSAGSRLRALVADRPVIRRFMVACLCAAGALALSVWLSDAPALNWWGSGLRRFGGATEVSVLVVMMATALLTGDPARLDRLCAAAAIGSSVPTIMALAQWTGFDPFDASAPPWGRPGSAFGNPLFLSGYLVTALPLTVACAIRSPRSWTRRAWWGLVALQALAFAAARSIGPVVALLAAATMVGAAWLASHRRRVAATAMASVATFTAVVALVAGPRLIAAGPTTLRVRAVLWQAAAASVNANPRRPMFFGSGPESVMRPLSRYADPTLRAVEGAEAMPDRVHNETLGTIVAFGAVGLAARLAIVYMALAAAFAVFGLLGSSSERTRFAWVTFGVNAGAVGLAWILGGTWTLTISVPMSVVLVASLWTLRRGITPRSTVEDRAIVPVAAAAIAMIAHYLEVQTGIATIASALTGAVALAAIVGAAAGPPEHALDRRRGRLGAFVAAAMVASAVLYVSVRGQGSTDDGAWAREATALVDDADRSERSRRDQLMRIAALRFERAWSVNPYDYHHARSRALLERRWALRLSPADRPAHLAEAERWYGAALEAAPSLPSLWTESANLALERGVPVETFQRLERALELGAALPDEAVMLIDAALGATGVDVAAPGGIEKGVEVLRAAGHPRLADVYAATRH